MDYSHNLMRYNGQRHIIFGNFLVAESLNSCKFYAGTWCVIGSDGKIEVPPGQYWGSKPKRYAHLPEVDLHQYIILQGLRDMHIHAPQYPMRGQGMDKELLDWLNTYTFPAEEKFAGYTNGKQISAECFDDMVRHGTTHACVYATSDLNACKGAYESMVASGLSGYIGYVNMDRNAPDVLIKDKHQSISDTVDFLNYCIDPRVQPIITPRFTPACSIELRNALGELAHSYEKPIQSHLSENNGEIKLVRDMEGAGYCQTYRDSELWTDRTLMAHCVWSNYEEIRKMAEYGVTCVHCPTSNANLSSGICDVRRLLNEGVRVVLGSDVAGGDTVNMFEVMRAAMQQSRLRYAMLSTGRALTSSEAYFLCTSSAQEWFGEKSGFAIGNKLSATVVEFTGPIKSKSVFGHTYSGEQWAETLIFNHTDVKVVAAVSDGVCIYQNVES